MGEIPGLSLINIIAAPFQRTRKNRLTHNEIIYFLAFDIKWMNMEQAYMILKRAFDEGLIGYEGGRIAPNFDIQSVENPFGFRSSQPFFKEYDPIRSLKLALDEYLIDYDREHSNPK